MKMMKRFAAAMLALTMVFGLCNFRASAAGHVDGLKQTEWSKDWVSVSWNMFAGAEDYAIFIANTPNEAAMKYKKDSSSVNNVMISGLNAGGTFYIQIRAYKKYVFGEKECTETPAIATSDIFTITTLPETPAAPASVIQTGATANTVTLTWSAVANVTGYEVRQYVNYDNRPVVADVPATQGTTAVIGGLAYSVKNEYDVYSYVIAPNGQKIYSSGSADVNAKTLPRAYASGEFGITSLWTGLKETDFRASAVDSNADDYVFQLKNKKTNKTVFTGKDLKMTGATKNKFLKYRVRGYININNGQTKAYGPYSGYKYFAWMEGFDAQQVGKKKAVKVTWKKVQGASGYDISISTSEKSGYKKVKSVSAKSNSVVVSKYGKKALKKNRSYYILITPKTKVGKKTVKSEAKWYAKVTFY